MTSRPRTPPGLAPARLGTYPFATYGSFVVDTDLGFALETQTISAFDRPWFTAFDRGVWDPTMLHELTHQWFGDSVSPWSWSDVWLNEGHASWYEEIWAARHGWLGDDTGTGIEDFTEFIKSVYAEGDQLRADWGPVARPASNDIFDLFSPNVYEGGSLVLFALRQKVGDDDFARIERSSWPSTATARPRRTTSSAWPRRSAGRTSARSCAAGSTGRRRRPCRGTRTGPWIRSRPARRRRGCCPPSRAGRERQRRP